MWNRHDGQTVNKVLFIFFLRFHNTGEDIFIVLQSCLKSPFAAVSFWSGPLPPCRGGSCPDQEAIAVKGDFRQVSNTIQKSLCGCLFLLFRGKIIMQSGLIDAVCYRKYNPACNVDSALPQWQAVCGLIGILVKWIINRAVKNCAFRQLC